MKAAVYHGPRDIRVEEIPTPKAGPGDVVFQVKYCGVCGTDVHIYNGEGGAFPVPVPLVPGHEYSGVVAEVGAGVTRLKVGDRVSADPNDACGGCYFCKNGKPHFCQHITSYGTTVNGGFAEYLRIPARQVYKIADDLGFMEAAMTEPMACCLHGIDLCDIKVGSTVLVIGAGPIGLIMMQLAKYSGAARLIMSEPVAEKRELAKKLGATLTVDPLHEDLAKILAGYTENVDCVIECVGNIHTEEQAVQLAGYGATVSFFGLSGPEPTFPLHPDDVYKKELRITSSFILPNTFLRSIAMLESKSIDLTSIVSDVLPLEDLVKAFTDPKYRRAGKVMIKVTD